MSHLILTTHVGSLPRPHEVLDLLFAQDRDEPVDAVAFDEVVQRGVDETTGSTPASTSSVTAIPRARRLRISTTSRPTAIGWSPKGIHRLASQNL
jgi:hypothetical protein